MTSKSSINFAELKVTDSMTLPQSDKQSLNSSMSDEDMLGDLDVGYSNSGIQRIEPVKTMRINSKPVFNFKNQDQLFERSERSPGLEKENCRIQISSQLENKIQQPTQRKRAWTAYTKTENKETVGQAHLRFDTR